MGNRGVSSVVGLLSLAVFSLAACGGDDGPSNVGTGASGGTGGTAGTTSAGTSGAAGTGTGGTAGAGTGGTAGAGTGGTAGASTGGTHGGTDAGAGTGGTAGGAPDASAGTGGTAGGAPDASAGTGGSAGTTGGSAGSGGSSSADAAPDAQGNPDAGSHEPLWAALVSVQENRLAAYDANTFPETTVRWLDGNGMPQKPWSHHGDRLLYFATDDLFVLDMTKSTIGSGMLLARGVDRPLRSDDANWYLWRHAAWSADDRSLAVVDEAVLFTIDPSAAEPGPHELTRDVRYFAWAPAGTKLLYADSTSVWVVSVERGVPGTPARVGDYPADVPIGMMPYEWSPRGTHLARWGQKVQIIDVSGAAPSISELPIYVRYGDGVAFSADGSKLAFRGETDPNTAPTQLYFVPVGGTAPIEPKIARRSCERRHDFAPDAPWLFCFASDIGQFGDWVAVNLGGENPSGETRIPLSRALMLHWASGRKLFAVSYEPPGVYGFDLATPAVAPVLLGPMPYYGEPALSPAGSTVAWLGSSRLQLAALDGPARGSIDVGGVRSGPYWSPDARFLVVLRSGVSSPTQIVKVDNASPAGKITFGYDFGFYGWQPRPL